MEAHVEGTSVTIGVIRVDSTSPGTAFGERELDIVIEDGLDAIVTRTFR